MKPPVDLADFQRVDLRIGTVDTVRPHPELTGLSILTVQLDEPVEALAPGSTPGLTAGARIVVAVGLPPLQAGGRRFTASLVSGPVGTEIPPGSRLS